MELFEREAPLGDLEEALQAVRLGEGRLALISGEAGIGKTSLVEHFTARLSRPSGEPIYWGACDALFTPRPLGPFIDIASQMKSGLLERLQSSQDSFGFATAFLEELKGLELKNPNFKFVGTMTDMAQSGRSWDGETGFLDHEMLSRYLKDAASPIYYIAGPPAMVTALRDMLNHAGVDDDDIRIEEFAGY